MAVSFTHYVTSNSYHYLNEYYNSRLPDDNARLMATIGGIKERLLEKWRVGLRNIREVFEIYNPWSEYDINCVIHFEALVGPRGGGSRELQRQEIRRITAHLETNLSEGEIEEVAEGIFDQQAATFRKGVMGDWRNYFTPEHKRAFKEVAGQLLIELGYEKDLDW